MLKTLQAGRAIAAICVAAFHLSLMMGESRYGGIAVFREYTYFGSHGVDFFFVLSGFIILFAHSKDIGQPTAWKSYIYRRFIRLYPIYWLYTFVFVLMFAILGGAGAKLPSSIGDWVTSLSLIRFTDGAPPLPVAWTLFHELAFYAAFSFLILNRKLGLLVLGIFMLCSIAYFQYPTESARTAGNVYTAAYNLYFLLGMGAFCLYRTAGRGITEFIIGLCCSIAVIANFPLPANLSWLMLVIGFSFMLTGITKFEKTGNLHVPYLLVFIGDASYTIYLTHSNLEGALMKIASKAHLPTIIGTEATFLFVLVGTIALGCLAYRLIELPLLTALRKKHSKQ